MPEVSERRPRVLVVEDEPTINQAISDRLTAEGFEVTQEYAGPAAVATSATWEPDVVVLDVMLPGFDGHEVCRRVQASRPVPVLMLTARDDETDVLVGLGVGADDYLTKPFSMRELVARLKALLRRVERASELVAPGVPEAGSPAALRLGPLHIWSGWRVRRAPSSPESGCSRRSGTGRAPRAPAPSTATSGRCAARSAPA